MKRRQRINFIPRELRPKFRVAPQVFPVFVALGVALYCGGAIVQILVQSKLRHNELNELTVESAQLSAKLASLTEQNRILERNDKALSAIHKVLGRKNYWSEIFKELSMLVPDGIWLTHFADKPETGTKKDQTTSPPLTQLSLSGEGDSQEVVAHFLTSLEKSHHFAGVQMKVLEKEAGVQPPRFKFEFTVPVKVLTGGG